MGTTGVHPKALEMMLDFHLVIFERDVFVFSPTSMLIVGAQQDITHYLFLVASNFYTRK